MRYYLFASLFIFSTSITYAQEFKPPTLNIGDNAPPLKVSKWIKGSPISNFEKGKIYVIDFWATWCHGCIVGMPHLSELAETYKGKITFIAMDVFEQKSTSLEKVSAFVDSLGKRMNLNVAVEDSNFMEEKWILASGEQGIPHTYVINKEGKIAWIGYPNSLEEVLSGITNNTWDIAQAKANRNEEIRLDKLDHEANELLNNYEGEPGKPDSALTMIADILKKEPNLKHAPLIACHTFSALLKTDPDKAYEYGKTLFETTPDDDAPYSLFIDIIKSDIGKWYLPDKIFELGAEAYHALIENYPWSQDIRSYLRMAEWYWRANDKTKAISAGELAVQAMKSK